MVTAMTSLSRLCRKTASKTLPGLLLISSAAVSGGHYASLKVLSTDVNGVNVRLNYNFLEENSNDVVQCQNDNDCHMSAGLIIDAGNGTDVFIEVYPMIDVKSGMTLKEIRDEMIRFYGASGNRDYSISRNVYDSYKCAGFALHSWSSRSFTLWPGTPCTNVPPPNVTCSFSLPSSVDFGTVSSGKQVTVQRRISGRATCSGNVTVTALSTKSVQLDGVNVAIDMNGQRLESGKNIVVGAGQKY